MKYEMTNFMSHNKSCKGLTNTRVLSNFSVDI
jgi:hypothetical protein